MLRTGLNVGGLQHDLPMAGFNRIAVGAVYPGLPFGFRWRPARGSHRGMHDETGERNGFVRRMLGQ